MNALKIAERNARLHLHQSDLAIFERVGANAFTLPFADGSVDIVMSFGLLEHFNPEALKAVLTEVIRILRPGGLFIVDVAHGRFSSRTLGIWISMFGSMMFSLLSFHLKKIREIPPSYLNHYFENDLNEKDYEAAFFDAGLRGGEIRVSHPFPPLAISGRLERIYVKLMRAAYPVWVWFYYSQPRWGRWWGWLYIAWGFKSQETSPSPSVAVAFKN
jgi:SAM-dependent methyltransferase